LLRNTRTIQTDGIRSVSQISQDGRWIEVDKIVGNHHVSEDPQGLVVYVPVDEEAQDFCFCSALAPDLADWLTRDPLTNIGEGVDGDMVPALDAVLVAEVFALDRILDHRGIIEISIPYEEVSIKEDLATGQLPTLGSVNGQPTQTSASFNRLPSNSPETCEEIPRTPALQASFPPSATGSPEQGLFRTVRNIRHTPLEIPGLSTAVSSENAGYLTLLDRALRAARSKAFPAKDALDMSSLATAWQGVADQSDYGRHVDGSVWHRLNRFERDKKVGAAGELYVRHIYTLIFNFASADNP
jgi:hypothetical protein